MSSTIQVNQGQIESSNVSAAHGAVRLVGVEHVGVGSDFDLDAHPTYDIAGLNHFNRVYELTEGLLRRGYTDAHLSLMLGGNFQRALQQIWA